MVVSTKGEQPNVISFFKSSMSKEIAGRKVTVLPLVIDNCEIPTSLSDKLYADFTKPLYFDISYEKLLKAIGVKNVAQSIEKPKNTLNKPDPAVIEENNAFRGSEIKIIGILKDRTRQDCEHSGLQDYYFQLSSIPLRNWVHFFNESRSFPRHSMWRRAWIDTDCVVVKCAINELQRYHLKDLKEDVRNASDNLAIATKAAELGVAPHSRG
ncbi:MAG: hypothetical protein R8L53_06545 [Mariprofundales bacterium]